MQRWFLAAAFILSATGWTSAVASSASDLAACTSASAGVKRAKTIAEQERGLQHGIAHCTRAIDAGGLNVASRVVAYALRGQMNLRLRNFDNAVADFTETIALMPGSAQRYVDRALAYLQKGDVRRAFADYNSAVRAEPNNLGMRLTRGYAYLKEREFGSAITDFSTVVQLQPRRAEGYLARSQAYLDAREFDKAFADAAEAINIDPKSPTAFIRRAKVHNARQESDSAIGDYNRALAIDPSAAEALMNRGLAYEDKGRVDDANRDFAQAARLDPQTVGVFISRGDISLEEGQFERALSDYDRAIRLSSAAAIDLNPDGAVVLAKRCRALASLGKAREAIEACNKSLQLSSGNKLGLTGRGLAHFRLMNFDAAIADYDAALRAEPAIADALYGRGVAKIKSGALESGNFDIAEAIKLDSNIAEQMGRSGVSP